jgi:hypothetical protein
MNREETINRVAVLDNPLLPLQKREILQNYGMFLEYTLM